MTEPRYHLDPCPAGHPNARVIGGPGAAGGPLYWAGCDDCTWRTWGETEAEAVEAWNSRAEPQTPDLPSGEPLQARGVARVQDSPAAVEVHFSRPLTDDELRLFHELCVSTASAIEKRPSA